MSKRKPSNDFEEQYLQLLKALEDQIRAIYQHLHVEAGVILDGYDLGDPEQAEGFSLSQHPIISTQVDAITQKAQRQLNTAIRKAVRASYLISTDKAMELVDKYLTGDQKALTAQTLKRAEGAVTFASQWFEKHPISRRVWEITAGFKNEVEERIKHDLMHGTPTDEISRNIRGFLNEPKKLFRRLRGKDGILRPSRRMASYHPGRGVYRSSYKNARRLALTEVNNAYRQADNDRWQKLDFVVGIRVQLSNNHTYRDHKGRLRTLVDICDDLKGDYPKDFQFTSWHPHCRCIATPILKSREEMARDRQLIREGKAPEPSSREIKGLPDNFKQWQTKNAKRITGATERGTLPHWLRNNFIPNEDGSLFPLCGYSSHTERLKAFRRKAVEMLRDKVFRDEITISNRGIKEWLNQPHKHKEEKDKAIFQIDILLKKAIHKGIADDKHIANIKTHIYETTISGEESYLIVREFKWGKQLHSISDSDNVLKYIKTTKK